MTTLPPPDIPVNSGAESCSQPPPIYRDVNRSETDSEDLRLSKSNPPPVSSGQAFGEHADGATSQKSSAVSGDRYSSSTAILVSFILHVILLLLLAFFLIQPDFIGSSGIAIDAVLDRTEKVDLEVLPSDRSPDEGAVENQSNSVATSSELETIETIPTTSPLAETAQQTNAVEELMTSASEQAIVTAFRNSAVAQRQNEQRAAAAAAHGGTRESEAAVENGLKWLIAHQGGDGAWSLNYRNANCENGCDHEGREGDYQPSATGLALLCFLGAGYSHREGPYQAELRKAIYYLITRIEYDESGEVGNLTGVSEHAMYNHGIATLALCEALQMTQDKDLEKPVRALLQYTVSAQHDVGGWGYSAATPGDLTISAWQVMSIKSAHNAGIRVPSDVMRRFDRFLDTQQSAGGSFYGYRGPGKQPGTTAMGLLLRMYRGWFRTDPRLLEGMNYLEKSGVSQTDVYFNFYATQVFFHQAGPAWDQWNREVRDFLVKSQAQRGHEAGSWSMIDSFSKVGGRLYCTCMSILTLEVYYRYPPMFQEITPDSFEF